MSLSLDQINLTSRFLVIRKLKKYTVTLFRMRLHNPGSFVAFGSSRMTKYVVPQNDKMTLYCHSERRDVSPKLSCPAGALAFLFFFDLRKGLLLMIRNNNSKSFKFIENATIHIFFWGVILASFLPQDIDKTGVIFYGLVGLVYRFGKPFRKEVDSLMIFAVYLMAVAMSYSLYKPFLYAILFLLQYGVIYYFIIVISKCGQALVCRWLNTIIRYNASFILIGLIDLLFYYNGDVTFLHEYYGWKISSFYLNPNHLGLISGVLFGFVLFSGVAIRARKLHLLILVLGTIISGSSMAMLLVPTCYVLKRISPGLYVTTAVAMATSLTVVCMTGGDSAFLQWVKNVFNYRIEIWSVALELFGDHKFFGAGTGMFQENIGRFLVRYPTDSSPNIYGLHSIYFWLLVECGLVGSSIYAYFILLQFNPLPRERLTIGYQKILLLLLTSQVTEFFIDHVEIYQLLFSLALGLIIQSNLSLKNKGIND